MKYYCTLCGCYWRQNPDESWSLYDAEQNPCEECDNGSNFLNIIKLWPWEASTQHRAAAWQYVAEFLHGRLQIDSRKTGRKVDSLGALFERALEATKEK